MSETEKLTAAIEQLTRLGMTCKCAGRKEMKMDRNSLNKCRATVSRVGLAQRRGYRQIVALHFLSMPRHWRMIVNHYTREMDWNLKNVFAPYVKGPAIPPSNGKPIRFVKYGMIERERKG